MTINVLFVCLGNICRSPAAEGVMKRIVADAGFQDKIYIDSAGTSAHHAGSRADSRMIQTAKQRGIDLTSISRPFDPLHDFEFFHYICVMDDSNLQDILELDRQGRYQRKVSKLTDFKEHRAENFVPDPYYGGAMGFEHVLDIVTDACHGLLKAIKQEQGL